MSTITPISRPTSTTMMQVCSVCSTSGKLIDLARELNECGARASDCAAQYLAAKQIRTDKVAEAVFIVADIAETALNTRLNEKAHILNQDEDSWKSLNDNINRLPMLYQNLRSVSLSREDQNRINRAARATEQYLAAAKSWVGNNRRMKAGATTMDRSGQVVGSAAVQYQGNKQTTVDTMAEAVFNAILAEKRRPRDQEHSPSRAAKRTGLPLSCDQGDRRVCLLHPRLAQGGHTHPFSILLPRALRRQDYRA